jgi:hypothetical protein
MTFNSKKNEILKYKIILIVLLFLISPLVISNFRFSSVIYPFLWISIPIFIYSLLPKKKPMLVTILMVLVLIPYLFTTLFSMLGIVMCGYSPKEYKYVSKQSDNIKLVGRDFSCYGTNEDLVLYKEFSISENIKIEIPYKTFVDYKNIDIDSTIWTRINHY